MRRGRDPRVNHQEVPSFIEGPSGFLFGSLSLPLGAVTDAVLICSSLHGDHQVNYRREVLLARAFASHGIATLRFDYRGTGNSDGRSDELTASSMIADAETALAFLIEHSGVQRPALMATRLGALIALSLPSSGAPLILWEPVFEASTFWKEAFRARAMHGLRERQSLTDDPISILSAEGVIDVMGYPVYLDTYKTTCDLDTGVGTDFAPGTSILLAQIGKNKRKAKEFAQVAERWTARGAATTLVSVGPDEAWWFFGDGQAAAEDLVETSRRWLLSSAEQGRGVQDDLDGALV